MTRASDPSSIREHIMLRFALLVALLASVGCASGPKGEAAAALPALAADKARIVFYRTASPIASLDQPNVLMDGVVIGKSDPGYFSYADVAPGTHLIECKGADANRISVQTPPGTTAYIETSVTAGINNFNVNVEQKPEAEAKKKIAGLSFRPPAMKPAAAPTTRP
jgi:hypothetical protein